MCQCSLAFASRTLLRNRHVIAFDIEIEDISNQHLCSQQGAFRFGWMNCPMFGRASTNDHIFSIR